MKDDNKTKEQLIAELNDLRQRSSELQTMETDRLSAEKAGKQAWEAVKLASAELSQIFQTAADGICVIDKHLNMLRINDTFATLLGVNKIEAVGKKCCDVIGCTLCNTADCALTRILNGEERVECEVEKQRNDGSKITCILTAAPFRGADGELIGIVENFKDITERKRAEEALRRQSAVLDSINKVFLETLTCKTDEEVARACLAVAEELTGSKFGFIGEVNQSGRFDTIALSDPGWDTCRMSRSDAAVMITDMEIRGIWGRVLKDEKSQIVNDPASHPDRVGIPEGHPLLTSFLGVPLKHAGRTIGMIALANKESGYNLTDQQDVETLSVAFIEALHRKRAEEALRESEERFRFIAETTGDVLYRLRYDTMTFDYLSPAITKLTGYSAEEINTIGFAGLLKQVEVAGNSGVSHKELARRRMEGKTGEWRAEYEICTKAGDLRWLGDHSFPWKDDSGKLVGSVGILQDITERKRTWEAVRLASSELSQIFQAAADGICVIDKDLNVLKINDTFATLLGVSKIEAVGKKCCDVIGFTLCNTDDCALTRILKGEERVECEVEKVRNDGSKITCILTAAPFRGADGELIGIVESLKDITERKRAVKELKSERDKLQALVDGLARTEIGIDIVGIDYKVQFQNQILKERYGDITGELCYDKYMGLKEPCEFCPMVNAIKNNRVESVEITSVDRRTYELISAPLPNPDGTVDKAIEVVRDITERKQAEEELQQSEERLRILFEYAPDAYYLSDLKGNFVDGNKAAEKLSGYNREELIGKSFLKLKLLPAKEIPKAAAALAKSVLGKPTGPDEFVLRRRDGDQVTVEISAFPVKIGGNTLVLGIARDITECKRTEEALKQSEQKYRFLVENSNELILILSKKGKILFANNKAVDVSGYAKEQLVGQSMLKILTKDSIPKALFALGQEFVGRPQPLMEVKIKRRSGEIRNLEIAPGSTPVYEKGESIGILINGWDITERKRVEERLSEANTRLKILQQVTAAVHQSLDPQEVFNQIIEVIVHSMGFTSAVILTLDDARQRYMVRAVSSSKKLLTDINKILGFRLQELTFPAEQVFAGAGEMALSGELVVVKHLVEIAYPPLDKATCQALEKLGGNKSYILAPLVEEEKLIGGIIITSGKEQVPADELNMLQVFARAASQAIVNADLYHKTSQAEEALRKSEENFRNIFQSVPESLLAVNKQIELLNSNKAFAELIHKYAPELNRSEDELRGKILSELRKHIGKTEHGIIKIGTAAEKRSQ